MTISTTPVVSQAIYSQVNRLDTRTRFWEIGEHSRLYGALVCFMKKVLDTGEIPFDVIRPAGQTGGRVRPHKRGCILVTAMGKCREFMDLYEPKWSYTADLQLFFDCYCEHPFGRVEPGMAAMQRFNDHSLVGEVYNDFIAFLRQKAVSRRVRKSLADWKANIEQQCETIIGHHEWVCAKGGVILPVRLDQSFARDAVDERDLLPRMSWLVLPSGRWRRVPCRAPSTTGIGEARPRIDPALAMEYRNRFLRNRYGADRWLFEHLAGYFVKMETGGRSGAHHFHSFYYFNATHRLPDRASLINGLTQRWRRVTGNLGWTFDCQSHGRRATFAAKNRWLLERFDADDPQVQPGFRDYLQYFVKTNFDEQDAQAVRVKPTSRANTLVTAQGEREADRT